VQSSHRQGGADQLTVLCDLWSDSFLEMVTVLLVCLSRSRAVARARGGVCLRAEDGAEELKERGRGGEKRALVELLARDYETSI
jgi:hypothetical protein